MKKPEILSKKLHLAFTPTPLVRSNLLKDIPGGFQLWIKRDDQTGLGLGGNKLRKLEFLLNEAVERNSDAVITAGAIQSNHCRQTAAACAQMGLECHLVLGGETPDVYEGNLLLDDLFGAIIHWAGPQRKGESIPKIEAELRAKGKSPYVIPYGGSNVIGALGFVDAAYELASQLNDLKIQKANIVFASSSGGTQSGLMVGVKLLGSEWNIHGIAIDKGAAGDKPFDQHILDLANELGGVLNMDRKFSKGDLILHNDFVGAGYAMVGDAEREAIRLCASRDGCVLDPVYTGRAMAGLLALCRQKVLDPEIPIIFWHTGGFPAVFAYSRELRVV